MAAHSTYAVATGRYTELHPVRVASFPLLRALAWRSNVLYASRGYALLRATLNPQEPVIAWEHVGRYQPQAWRTLTSALPLASRLYRDGFHALATLKSGHLIAAVPHAIVVQSPAEKEFLSTHNLLRGTRPLHFATSPNDHVFWGEYFDNPRRDEVHIYASTDRGAHWDVAHTFPKGAIRHIHNIVYDEWDNCFWVLTGDEGPECRILRASCDFKTLDLVLSGTQQTRSAALIPTAAAVYFSSDTPEEINHVYRLDRRGNLQRVAMLSSSSISACELDGHIFFSTMVEPSAINSSCDSCLYGSADGTHWQRLLHWEKDRWPMALFQYGNVFLPDGKNTTGLLALTTIALKRAGLQTSIWRV